jgi:hypothetical protein
LQGLLEVDDNVMFHESLSTVSIIIYEEEASQLDRYYDTISISLKNTVVPPYPQVIHSKTYCGYVKPEIIPNAIRNVIFV